MSGAASASAEWGPNRRKRPRVVPVWCACGNGGGRYRVGGFPPSVDPESPSGGVALRLGARRVPRGQVAAVADVGSELRTIFSIAGAISCAAGAERRPKVFGGVGAAISFSVVGWRGLERGGAPGPPGGGGRALCRRPPGSVANEFGGPRGGAIPPHDLTLPATRRSGRIFHSPGQDRRDGWGDMISGKERWAPAFAVLLPYVSPSEEAVFGPALSIGLAGGSTLEPTMGNGFLETVERDAFANWWTGGIPVPRAGEGVVHLTDDLGDPVAVASGGRRRVRWDSGGAHVRGRRARRRPYAGSTCTPWSGGFPRRRRSSISRIPRATPRTTRSIAGRWRCSGLAPERRLRRPSTPWAGTPGRVAAVEDL